MRALFFSLGFFSLAFFLFFFLFFPLFLSTKAAVNYIRVKLYG